MSDKDNLIKFSERVKQKQSDLRREYERFLFNKILGCYTVIEKLGIKPIEINDISKSGSSFSMNTQQGSFEVGEKLDLRFYFSNKSFLSCHVKITRAAKVETNFGPVWQYGCTFDKKVQSYDAIKKFVDFIEAFSEHAKEDKGDSPVLYF
ncbi:hypothetical protein GW915_06595 [bacterium]|nr:hypothetical protein [bacterium]